MTIEIHQLKKNVGIGSNGTKKKKKKHNKLNRYPFDSFINGIMETKRKNPKFISFSFPNFSQQPNVQKETISQPQFIDKIYI